MRLKRIYAPQNLGAQGAREHHYVLFQTFKLILVLLASDQRRVCDVAGDGQRLHHGRSQPKRSGATLLLKTF
jgi:hypothetical protein